MEGAKKVKCSEFATEILRHMDARVPVPA
jgi:hypothetical protein